MSDGIWPVHPASQPEQPIRYKPDARVEDHRLADNLNAEPVAGLDSELTTNRTGHGDLVLGADLDA